ncbi:MAG: putative zinc-binding metallopeptidase, partial [Steroidobacter sp.]
MKHYSCPKCSSRLAFEALSCWHCETELGYVFKNDSMVSLRDLPAAARCVNRSVLSCNWIVDPAVPDNSTLCPGCRYTRTIPPQQEAENRVAWRKFEHAKRCLLYSLKSLGLSPPDRIRQPATGLAFDFLTPLPEQSTVLTAHASGVITINITEADDARREQRRTLLNEPHRTLLGHLQHETGHFYWDQLIANSAFLDKYRSHFGDERQDYDSALQSHYRNTDASDNWRSQFVSRYASAHPWEDWAET